MKDQGLNVVLWLWGYATAVLEIKNTVVVVVVIFLKHNDLCGQVVSSSQLCSQSILCKVVCMHVMCTVLTVHAVCEGLLTFKNWVKNYFLETYMGLVKNKNHFTDFLNKLLNCVERAYIGSLFMKCGIAKTCLKKP